ncbi:MAG: ankyrin repeat domain-containing protein [Rickettsia endosymbiont of Ixodes persulcatus]|nr:ankyrin repeat domain-containing protein [Rickettsia endosymbiont of Ixodes persulcatus]MCZ6903098.1 ankyrin repeat domain-containing protein [Rickettsia endosymbiont of Ixodes persulcatus]MCZ6908771.1 ankyrin repeat domain-containing protein [Rickettsia endosymbiont of Ixodes persulcatus]MCZ6910622.1 ankyrin repeat domain-containing protein [Rickettsia endosymbiont of Ixodes persulcatus]MCZ6919935.1 ankyrin repeat domain-containing protein [Rickettsia endosymbiont of Ixodes persulcatus]
MKYLIEIKAPINLTNKNNQTPLDIAYIKGHTDMINLLSMKLVYLIV